MLLCLLLTVLLAVPAAAAAPDQPDGAEVLGAAWEWYEKVPDYSSGYWLGEDGVLTVGLVDEAGKAEVLAIVGDAPVNFVTHAYSYNELMAVQRELEEYFAKDVGLVSVAVYVMDNRVEADLDVTHPAAALFAEKMVNKHGDRLVFREAEGPLLVLDAVTDPMTDPILTGTVVPTVGAEAEEKPANNTPATAVGVVLIAAAAVLLSRSRRKGSEEKKKEKED